MTAPDLVELHRCLAALVNPQCHFDMQAYPELERMVEIAIILDLIEEKLDRTPWRPAAGSGQ